MHQQRFQNKTIVITGGSSGIGAAMARAFAAEGGNVVVNYCRSNARAQTVVDDIVKHNGNAISVQADVADQQSIEQLIDVCQQHYGVIDVWVNNAGADILTGSAQQLSLDDKLHRLIDVDLKGTINCCWAIAPIMRQQGNGVIINNAWDLAMHGFHGDNPQIFAATKAGILGFSRSLALSYAPELRVNIIAPGWIHTDFAEHDMDDAYYQARIAEIPLARFGRPDDVANVTLYLASDDAAYITGEVININGGQI